MSSSAILSLVAFGGSVWGHGFQVYSTNKEEVTCIDFHSISPGIEIDFVRDDRKIRIEFCNTVGQYDASGGVGSVQWKGIRILFCGKASRKFRNTKCLVSSVTSDETQSGGLISLYKKGLDEDAIEELVIVAIDQIEGCNRLSRSYLRTVTETESRSLLT